MNNINFKIKLEKDPEGKGIWQYSSYLEPVKDEFKLTLGEGNTEHFVFQENIILKREDKNPTGSLKDRGMAYLVSHALSLGYSKFVLSSSGNAAVSAASYCSLRNLDLTVFISPGAEEGKVKKLEKTGIAIIKSKRAVSDSLKFAKDNGLFNLRPSTNVFGPEGYQTIAFELLEKEGAISDIFIPVSSGVALLGIARGFRKMGFLPRVHLCQSSEIHSLASLFDKNYISEKKSLARALVARSLPLKNEIMKIIKESKGTGWVIGNKEIENSQEELSKSGIETSNEGALTLAAVFKARKNGVNLGKTVCLLTGTKY